jgi:hypothetical protein
MRQQRSRRKSEENIRRKWTVAIHKTADKAEKNKKRSRDPQEMDLPDVADTACC